MQRIRQVSSTGISLLAPSRLRVLNGLDAGRSFEIPMFRDLGQRVVDKRNRDRPFTDCRCHAFEAAAANVTHGEHARKRGFEQMGCAVERPPGSGEIFLRQVPSGLDETFRIERDTAIQPTGVGFGPRHQKYVPNILTRYRARAVAPPHTLKMSVSLKSHDLGSRLDLDCWGLLDASNQVSRHPRRTTAGADDQMNVPRRLRPGHRGLTGRA